MPKLPRVSGRKVAKALQKAGFELARIAGNHAYLRNYETNRRVVVPLSSHTCPVGTLASILRQAGLTTDDLRRLLE